MSAILSADDLNDFISPGVACIKPVETLPKEENSNPYEVTTEDKVQAQNPAPASISLTDCLACSGCVTSAEAVLVSLQSHSEVLNTLDSYPSIDLRTETSVENIPPNARVFVASVSPQVRASIAATFGLSERRAGFLIEQFLSGLQGLRIGGRHNSAFDYVVDTNRMREACLALSVQEVQAAVSDRSKPRPVLTSACPGWICYAEKTHPHVLPHLSALKSPQALTGTLLKSVLSKALNIHPSQIWHLAIMPCFDKKLEASREELTDKWWSSSDDPSATPAVRDVDCVITSKELLTLAEARGIQLSTLPQTPLLRSERASFPDTSISNFLLQPHTPHAFQGGQSQSPDAGTSGGYLAHILHTYQSLYPNSTITTTRGRNADVIEYTLHQPSTPHIPILKAARYYGFRNIQNLVRKLKPARQSRLPGAATRRSTPTSKSSLSSPSQSPTAASEYAYVEVMACPGGCTNGGGQIKIEDVAGILPQTRGETIDPKQVGSALSQKEWLARVDEAYFSADSDSDVDVDVEMTSNSDDKLDHTINGNGIVHHETSVDEFLSHWSRVTGIPLEKLVYTTYRKVESDVGKSRPGAGGNGMSDSQRIAAIAGLEGGGW